LDIEKMRRWSWRLAQELIKSREETTLERFLTDLRSSNLPHEFSTVIADSLVTFRKAGISVPAIPYDLQYFSSVTDFKTAKAIIVATIYNALVQKEKGEVKEG